MIRPFLPAKDFGTAKSFYTALGFTIGHQDDGLAVMNHADGSFFLQNYWQKDWAENFMLGWSVDDLDAWYQAASKVVEPLGGKGPSKPEMKPWGMVVSDFIDPSGVCWHVSEKAK